jgi:hypothetical protein
MSKRLKSVPKFASEANAPQFEAVDPDNTVEAPGEAVGLLKVASQRTAPHAVSITTLSF